MTSTTKTARLWAIHRDSWVRISLRDGDTVETYCGGRDEEGFHWRCCAYSREGGTLSLHTTQGGRDCDGPYGHPRGEEYTCDIGDIPGCTGDDPQGPMWLDREGVST